MASLLDNISWHALSGAQAAFAIGTGGVRRYARGFSPIAAFADPSQPDFDGLAAVSEPGERVYCLEWTGLAPEGWRIEADTTLYRMGWAGETPPTDPAFDDAGQLIAMAGERMFVGHLREISGVCTRPGHQGKGLASKLMRKLIRRQCLRGETPFLHVMRANELAVGLYERMGFRIDRESTVRVISMVGD